MKGRERAQDHVGRRPERQLRLGGLQGRAGGRRRASPARSCATTATSTRPRPRRAKRVEAEYYIPHLAHATMEPPAATARIVGGKCEVWACVQSPQAARDLVAKRLGMSRRQRDRARHAAGRRLRPQVEARLRHRGGRALAGDGRRAGQGDVDARGRSAQRLLPHGLGRAPRGRPGRAGQARRLAAPHRGADHLLDLRSRRRSTRRRSSWAWASSTCRSRFPNIRIENPEAIAHTRIGWFRSVSNIPHAFAVQSFVAELAAAAGRDPKDYLLDLIGPARQVDPGGAGRHLEPRRIAGALPGRHRPPAARHRAGRARGGLGPEAAEGPGPRHRRALQLRDLRRGGGRGRGRQQGRARRSRASTSRSTAAPPSTPTGCARRWRARA